MSTTLSKFVIPRAVKAPRGARWAGAFFATGLDGLVQLVTFGRLAVAGTGHIGRGIWRSLEAIGQARAHRALSALAARHEADDPALARRLREAGRFVARPRVLVAVEALAAPFDLGPQQIEFTVEGRPALARPRRPLPEPCRWPGRAPGQPASTARAASHDRRTGNFRRDFGQRALGQSAEVTGADWV